MGWRKRRRVSVARGVAQTVAGTGVTLNSVLVGPTASDGAGAFAKESAKHQGITAKEFEKQFLVGARPTAQALRDHSGNR
jgi:NAD(P)-dependent dehydrogenase (short-subunit alcohol dehydrogenase family)